MKTVNAPKKKQPTSETLSAELPEVQENNSGSEEKSVDRIRDILFGSQMEDYDERFQQLEQQLARNVAEIKKDLNKRLDGVEAQLKTEASDLRSRLDKEENQRSKSFRTVDKELQGMGEKLLDQIRQMDSGLEEKAQQLTQEILENKESFQKEFAQLNETKTDRAALAGLLNEIAAKLRS